MDVLSHCNHYWTCEKTLKVDEKFPGFLPTGIINSHNIKFKSQEPDKPKAGSFVAQDSASSYVVVSPPQAQSRSKKKANDKRQSWKMQSQKRNQQYHQQYVVQYEAPKGPQPEPQPQSQPQPVVPVGSKRKKEDDENPFGQPSPEVRRIANPLNPPRSA